MSRIGNRVLTIPENVSVDVNGKNVTVKGPKGELSLTLSNDVDVKVEGNTLTVLKLKNNKIANQMHGTTNANLNNMIKGVSEGYTKGLEIIGVGYRFNVKGNVLVVNAGYSHPVEVNIPAELTVEAINNNEIVIKGINKELVGEFAANIRKIRKPEPYKGKGIRYKDEHIRRKEGKKASK